MLSKTNIHGSLRELVRQDERGKKMATTTLKREEIIQKAEKKGRMALVDPVPDPTEAGKAMWIQNIREYFTEVCDSMVSEYNAQDMRGDILAGLERGFRRGHPETTGNGCPGRRSSFSFPGSFQRNPLKAGLFQKPAQKKGRRKEFSAVLFTSERLSLPDLVRESWKKEGLSEHSGDTHQTPWQYCA